MKKKILFMVLNGKEYGGSEKNVQDLLKYLDEDFMVTLVYSEGNPIVDKLEQKRKITSYAIKRNIIAMLTIFKIINKEKPDIVHFHAARAVFMGRLVSNIYNLFKRKKLIIITTIHGLYLPTGKNNFIIRYLLRIFSTKDTKTICVSNEDRKILRKEFKYKSDIEVIYNGVELDEYMPSSIKNFNKKIGFVGRLSKQKNPIILLELAKYLKSDFELIIYGNGPMMDELTAKCEQEKIENVFFKGFVDNVKEAYDEISILVSFSLFEGLPYSYIESICSGVPVVATNVGGVGEIIKNGYNGSLISSSETSMENIINSIDNIIQSYEEYSCNSIRSAMKFSITSMIENYTELYYEVLGESK